MHKRLILILFSFPIIVSLVLYSSAFKVGPGESAVIISPFSSTPRVKGPGGWYTFPWDDIHIYDMTSVNSRLEFEVFDKENIPINIDVNIRFKLIRKDLGILDGEIGKGYKNIMDSSMVSITRRILINYTTEEIYITKRFEIENAITEALKSEALKYHFELQSLLIMSIVLPPDLEKEIQLKFEENSYSEK